MSTPSMIIQSEANFCGDNREVCAEVQIYSLMEDDKRNEWNVQCRTKGAVHDARD